MSIEYLSPIDLPKLENTHVPTSSGEVWENLTTGDLMYFDGAIIHNITANLGLGGGVNGGRANTIYLIDEEIDGGRSDSVYT